MRLEQVDGVCRTPPGVRELKLVSVVMLVARYSRTPPGVRELKLKAFEQSRGIIAVAPLPGCVN